jgi:co-chaperonin GroES (HSP10)
MTTALAFETAQPKPLFEIPKPCGWRVLVAMTPVETKSAGGILLPDSHLDQKQAVATVGYVVALGPQAYRRVDTGTVPWAIPGDRVLVAKYAGQRYDAKVHGETVELRLVNDDEIQAVLEDAGKNTPEWVVNLIHKSGAHTPWHG